MFHLNERKLGCDNIILDSMDYCVSEVRDKRKRNNIVTGPHPTTCRLQHWNSSGQTTSKIGTQPDPSADRLPKVILSSQPPQNTPLNTALTTRGTRPSSTHQRAGTSPSHQEDCTSPWTNLTHQGADTRSKRNYDSAACRKETTNTES